MRFRLGLLIFLAFLGALVGCDDDDSHYVAPYDVCAAHHGDATACRAEPGCRVFEESVIITVFNGQFCMDTSLPYPPCMPDLSLVDENAECTAYHFVDENTIEFVTFGKYGYCSLFTTGGEWERANSSLGTEIPQLSPCFDEGLWFLGQCYQFDDKESCLTFGGCAWIEGARKMVYTDNSCEEVEEVTPQCVSPNKQPAPDPSLQPEDGGPYTFVRQAEDSSEVNVLDVPSMRISTYSPYPEMRWVLMKEGGEYATYEVCTPDSTVPGCACTLDGTDATAA